MCFLRSITSFLLLAMVFLVLSRGRKQCNIPKIIRTYKAVIFYELQNLKNITGLPEDITEVTVDGGHACRSDKDQRILQSIYSLSVNLKYKANCDSQRSRRKKKLESAICRVTSQMTSVFKENCRHIHRKHDKNNKPQTGRNRDNERKSKTRRKEFHRRVETIRLCWEKLNLRCQSCDEAGSD
ncbi:uncharacterized protein C20orf204-like isoform X2 [Protopterus annectens]|uniref:uncharacterized protein C20orf204-like isoform X2 n=1 Tax=Protopterus annectens TaxID=7888 RepID=UPI001CFAEF80|nr:uncharacterized protein C20orf204-like isoform X2 [Protopterus annectens]